MSHAANRVDHELVVGPSQFPERQFRLWHYTVSHRALLLRAVGTATHPTRVDVFFKGVSAVRCPTTLDGLCLDAQRLDGDTVRFHLTGDRQCWIDAAAGFVHTDTGEDHDPSHFTLPTLAWDRPG